MGRGETEGCGMGGRKGRVEKEVEEKDTMHVRNIDRGLEVRLEEGSSGNM